MYIQSQYECIHHVCKECSEDWSGVVYLEVLANSNFLMCSFSVSCSSLSASKPPSCNTLRHTSGSPMFFLSRHAARSVGKKFKTRSRMFRTAVCIGTRVPIVANTHGIRSCNLCRYTVTKLCLLCKYILCGIAQIASREGSEQCTW